MNQKGAIIINVTELIPVFNTILMTLMVTLYAVEDLNIVYGS